MSTSTDEAEVLLGVAGKGILDHTHHHHHQYFNVSSVHVSVCNGCDVTCAIAREYARRL